MFADATEKVGRKGEYLAVFRRAMSQAPGFAECRTPATARAPRPERPAPGLQQSRCRGRFSSGWRSVLEIPFSRLRRWSDEDRWPSLLPITSPFASDAQAGSAPLA